MANGLENIMSQMYGQPVQTQNLGASNYLGPAQANMNPLSSVQPQGVNENMTLNQFGPQQVVNDLVTGFTNPTNPYIANARQRGIEQAAGRGLMNSSIAGANAERSAIEAAQPLVSEAVGLLNAREQRALTKDTVQQQAVLQDWLDTNKFNREFNGSLSLLPIKNTFDMFQTLMQYGAENPQVWTPDVISGTSNFFQRNMFDILNQYFPGTFNRGGTP